MPALVVCLTHLIAVLIVIIIIITNTFSFHWSWSVRWLGYGLNTTEFEYWLGTRFVLL